jgi:hypothetical protein
MSITATLDSISLPEDMIWLDQSSWTPVAQGTEYSLAGSLLIEQSKKLAGRPITLGGDNAWTTWKVAESIIALSYETEKEMTLVLNDRTFTVMFRHEDGDVVDITRIYDREPEDDDEVIVKLRLMVIEETTDEDSE